MRLFIAADLPILHHAWLTDVVQQLKKKEKLRELRWQTPEQWHITLKFLGECLDNKLAAVQDALKDAARGAASFRLALRRPGSFRGPRGAVLYIGVEQGNDALAALANHLQESLASIGFPKETRNFHAHVTLARSKNPKPLSLKDFAPAIPCPEVFADQLALYQSHLGAGGSRYEKLMTAHLGP